MKTLRFALAGAGYWARPQLAGWRELAGVECVAVYNRTRSRAEALSREFGIAAVYDSVEEMLDQESLDFLDVVTSVETHAQLVCQAAARRLAVVCQKPLAVSLAEAEEMVACCRAAGVPLLVNENWRWQKPLRHLQEALQSGAIGRVFRARLDYCNSYPVFDNQPFLRELDQFILTDVGTHLLDAVRFLFGEAVALTCRTHRVTPGIRGEDAATVLLDMVSGATVSCNLSYASRLEHDRFPETFVLVEGALGSIELGPDYWLRVTTRAGTHSRRFPPPYYPWVDPRLAVVQASIVDCQRDLLDALRTGVPAATHADDNLKTLKLVFGAYDAAASGNVVRLT